MPSYIDYSFGGTVRASDVGVKVLSIDAIKTKDNYNITADIRILSNASVHVFLEIATPSQPTKIENMRQIGGGVFHRNTFKLLEEGSSVSLYIMTPYEIDIKFNDALLTISSI